VGGGGAHRKTRQSRCGARHASRPGTPRTRPLGVQCEIRGCVADSEREGLLKETIGPLLAVYATMEADTCCIFAYSAGGSPTVYCEQAVTSTAQSASWSDSASGWVLPDHPVSTSEARGCCGPQTRR